MDHTCRVAEPVERVEAQRLHALDGTRAQERPTGLGPRSRSGHKAALGPSTSTGPSGATAFGWSEPHTRRSKGRGEFASGAPGRTRTADAHLRTVPLYPLSYGGVAPIVPDPGRSGSGAGGPRDREEGVHLAEVAKHMGRRRSEEEHANGEAIEGGDVGERLRR